MIIECWGDRGTSKLTYGGLRGKRGGGGGDDSGGNIFNLHVLSVYAWTRSVRVYTVLMQFSSRGSVRPRRQEGNVFKEINVFEIHSPGKVC